MTLKEGHCGKIRSQVYQTMGLKIHANYVNRLEHKGYMVVEADSFEQIDAAFDPVLEMGHFEVTPVMQR
ncbi:hypothetical protein N9767_01565 [Planktomarina temperata]|nr:hypothetical protein [Planktomarina temperata]